MNEHLPDEIARFVAGAAFSVTLALPGERDRVLAAANRHFCDLTGYQERDILGRDCRFLQGEATSPQSREAMRGFFDDPAQTQTRIEVVNYRRDGRPFVNLVYLSKLKDRAGAVRYLFASQFDVSRAGEAATRAYEGKLGAGLANLSALGRAHQLGVETSLAALAASTHAIATAKLALAELEARAP